MVPSFTVRDLPASERPRERLLKHGPAALSIPELLALVLGRGGKNMPVLAISQSLLAKFGSLRGIASASVEQLGQVGGIKTAKATQLRAVFELGRRLTEEPDQDKPAVGSPEDAVRQLLPRLKGKKKEHFVVVALDVRNRVLAMDEVSVGSLDTSIAHPREVFQKAISLGAASVIVAHNHPSGDPEPSDEDIRLTKRLVEAGGIVGIGVTDHIIVCDRTFLSLKGRNLF